MVCGGYEDDADDGHELTYTGTATCLSTGPSAFYALPFDIPQKLPFVVVFCEVFKDDDHELTYTGTAPCLLTALSAFYALPFDTPQSCLLSWYRVKWMRMMAMS